MAIVLHELTTNAAKYGSLSSPDGKLDVSWHVFGGSLHLKWTESGGPVVKPPQTQGFGTKIISSSVGKPGRGSVEYNWRPEGLSCVLTLELVPEEEKKILGNGPILNATDSLRSSRRILLVEDEVLVSLLMQETLRDMGYSVGEACSSLNEAFSALASRRIDGAILDINLGGISVYPLADFLAARDIPFIFVTGYTADAVDPKFANVPILKKPVMRKDLENLLKSWIDLPPTNVSPPKARLNEASVGTDP